MKRSILKTCLNNYQAVAHHSCIHVIDATRTLTYIFLPFCFPLQISLSAEEEEGTLPVLVVLSACNWRSSCWDAFLGLEADSCGYSPSSHVLHQPHLTVSFLCPCQDALTH